MNLLDNIPALLVIGAIAIPLFVYAYLGIGERVLALLPTPMQRIRPWVWLVVPLGLVALILVYTVVSTIVISVMDGEGRLSADNFIWAFTGAMRDVLVNNATWIIVFPLGTLALALIVAVLFDRVRYEKIAMTLIVLPTAISFTAGSVIWRQMYSYQPPANNQLGLINAILLAVVPGAQPIPWLQTPVLNTFALIFVAVWSSLGVAALILSAAVKGVPAELSEAARLDGASEWMVFRSVTLPAIAPAILVVLTTEIIFALKVFDIVYVMTNGNFGTNVIANEMYNELFAANNPGRASAIAVILLIAAIPVVAINIRQFRAEAEQ